MCRCLKRKRNKRGNVNIPITKNGKNSVMIIYCMLASENQRDQKSVSLSRGFTFTRPRQTGHSVQFSFWPKAKFFTSTFQACSFSRTSVGVGCGSLDWGWSFL